MKYLTHELGTGHTDHLYKMWNVPKANHTNQAKFKLAKAVLKQRENLLDKNTKQRENPDRLSETKKYIPSAVT